jgi:hypothetical protein
MSEQKHTQDLSSPCLIWGGAIDEDGYGRLQVGDKWKLAHRVKYEESIGQIPRGLVIDHLCRNRSCVNVLHMETVTNKENVLRGNGITATNARKVACKKGHPFSPENTIVTPNGGRSCRECGRERWRAYRSRKIAEGTWSRT